MTWTSHTSFLDSQTGIGGSGGLAADKHLVCQIYLPRIVKAHRVPTSDGSTMIDKLKTWARNLKRDVFALWIAARDPRVPWSAKAVAGGVAAYALSPIDLIPDFIPVFGYLDDMIIVPLGIILAVKLIPPNLMKEFRHEALSWATKPVSRLGLAFIVVVWLVAATWLVWLFWAYSKT